MKKLWITGHRGMVGSALVREAARRGGYEVMVSTRQEVDLCDQASVFRFLQDERPEVVMIAAAKVGGIHANRTYPADFIYENLAIAMNVIEGSRRSGVERLLFLGSSCIYPRDAPQPMAEECLLSSELEVTNEAYAIAKIAGLKLCQHYRAQHGCLYHSVMPTNLYGPGDNYHPEHSHVIPGMIRRFHEAKEMGLEQVAIWGSGRPRREFLYVDDLARACFHVIGLENPPDWLNVGTGEDMTIMELAQRVGEVVGYHGRIVTDESMPDGTMRKWLDCRRIQQLGWQAEVEITAGLHHAYQDFLQQWQAGRLRA